MPVPPPPSTERKEKKLSARKLHLTSVAVYFTAVWISIDTENFRNNMFIDQPFFRALPTTWIVLYFDETSRYVVSSAALYGLSHDDIFLTHEIATSVNRFQVVN